MKWFLVILGGFCLIATRASCEDTDVRVEELTDSRTTITWRPTDDKTIIVQAEEGYQIQVDTTQLDVDGENDNYVTVKSLTEDEDEDNNDALMFTYTVSGKPSYLYNYNRVQADYNGTTESNIFLIQFTRVGEAATTPPPTTTTAEPMPTAPPEQPSNYTVYLYGRKASDYETELVDDLTSAIFRMGVDYCYIQGCPLNGSITRRNAKLDLLEQCPIIWEHHEKCVSMTFSIPIIKLDDYDENGPWGGYQLNKSHLKVLWDTYGERYMHELGLNLYNVPDINNMTINRLIVSFSVIVGLLLLIFILRVVLARLNKKRRRLSDTVSIMGQQSNRNSQLSLTPHYLQELPPLFSNDFPLYNDKMPPKPFTDFQPSFSDDVDPAMLPSPSNILNISGNNHNGPEDVDA